MRRFRVVGVRVKLDAAKQAEGVFSIVILLKKPKKLPKLGRRSRAPGGLGKVGSRVSFRREESYLGEGIVDTFKDRI